MTDVEVGRIERAMDRQADKIGGELRSLGDKIDAVGNRVTRVETKIEDHLEDHPRETTGSAPAPQPPEEPSLKIPWRVIVTIVATLAAGGGGWEALRSLF